MIHNKRVTVPANKATQIAAAVPTRTWLSVSIVSVAGGEHVLLGDFSVSHENGFKLVEPAIYGAPISDELWAFSPTDAVLSLAGIHT
jgi:hypothetical protein